MKRGEIVKHLADANNEVLEDAARVDHLRVRLQELREAKASQAEIDKAFSDMIVMEERLSLHEQDRDWFTQALKTADE